MCYPNGIQSCPLHQSRFFIASPLPSLSDSVTPMRLLLLLLTIFWEDLVTDGAASSRIFDFNVSTRPLVAVNRHHISIRIKVDEIRIRGMFDRAKRLERAPPHLVAVCQLDGNNYPAAAGRI